MNKSYSELINLKTFQERFDYLRLKGFVGKETFGGHRALNQLLYQSDIWKRIRNQVILRDSGNDMAHEDYPIMGKAYIHHINPITIDDILNKKSEVFDLENLICTSFKTHNAIHYGNDSLLSRDPINRKPNDTCPWR